MSQSLNDIALLAGRIGGRYLSRGKVNLEKIAKDKRIRFVRGNYEDHFLGQLVHLSKQFYIILNSDLLSKSESGRIRFTIAHELGHYFIDGHREKLAAGISLSFNGEIGGNQPNKYIEVAANHFAAYLLMPPKVFDKKAKKLEPGLAAIFDLKEKFDTSIESTTKHYINQNITTSIMIKWRADMTFHYAWYSRSFANLTGIRGIPPIRFNKNYIEEQVSIIEEDDLDYTESAVKLSQWISTITPGTPKDILGLEQTVKLGDFGGITLLTFTT